MVKHGDENISFNKCNAFIYLNIIIFNPVHVCLEPSTLAVGNGTVISFYLIQSSFNRLMEKIKRTKEYSLNTVSKQKEKHFGST